MVVGVVTGFGVRTPIPLTAPPTSLKQFPNGCWCCYWIWCCCAKSNNNLTIYEEFQEILEILKSWESWGVILNVKTPIKGKKQKGKVTRKTPEVFYYKTDPLVSIAKHWYQF